MSPYARLIVLEKERLCTVIIHQTNNTRQWKYYLPINIQYTGFIVNYVKCYVSDNQRYVDQVLFMVCDY